MSKLLYIESSPTKDRSFSIKVAHAFLKKYREINRDDEVDTFQIWETPLPDFDGHAIGAKYKVLHGQDPTREEAAAWERVVEVIERFKSADKILFGIPMWNFGIPYRLKHFFDVIVQPGQAFNYSPEEGYTGLITGRPVMAIYARGGSYEGEMAQFDHQKTYMEAILGFIGFTDIRSIIVSPTLMGENPQQVTQEAIAEAEQKAADF